MRYELITESGNYALILRKEALDEYAVVHGLNKENGSWNHTVSWWNFGAYSGWAKAEALSAAIECFRVKTEENYISRSRLEELATLFKDGLIEDDEYEAMYYFNNICDMTESEKKFFGVDDEEEDENYE